MQQSEFEAFCALMDGVCTMLSRGAYRPNAASSAMFFRALARHPITVVRKGFDAHVADTKRGQFVPTPADILAQIEGLAADDGRPGAEEAWALAVRASDESETVVWTDEMAQAWLLAKPLMDSGDQIGARMAFKESYARQIDDARRARVPVAWSTSLGHDQAKRHDALVKAETMGFLAAGEALRLALPTDVGNAFQHLIEASARRADAQTVRERVAALKAILIKPEPDHLEAVRQRELLNRRKAEVGAAVAVYLAGQGDEPTQANPVEVQ